MLTVLFVGADCDNVGDILSGYAVWTIVDTSLMLSAIQAQSIRADCAVGSVG